MERRTAHREKEIIAAITALSDVDAGSLDEKQYMDVLARHSVALLDADAAAVLIADRDGGLRAVAATAESAHRSLLVQLDHQDGPSLASYRGRGREDLPDVRLEQRWGAFRTNALRAGFVAVHTIPLQRRDSVFGVLTLYRHRPGPLTDDDDRLAAALADLATGHLLTGRALARAERLAGQLQTALHSRVVIEQAKGILAERHGLTINHAFEMLRAFARCHRRKLDHVARAVVERTESIDPLPPRTAGPTAR